MARQIIILEVITQNLDIFYLFGEKKVFLKEFFDFHIVFFLNIKTKSYSRKKSVYLFLPNVSVMFTL